MGLIKARHDKLKEKRKKERKKNQGGIIGGIGYVVGKAVTGALDVVEDTADVLIGGTADLLGFNEFAKKVHTDDYTDKWNYSLDEWYNPNGVVKTIGDIGSGIGQSATYVGLSLIPYAGPALAKTAMAGSGVGSGIQSAVEKTGNLGAKEYIYGGLSGATEVALESLTGAAGKVATKLAKPAAKGVKSVAKSIGKESAEALAKKGAKSAAKTVGRKGLIRTTLSGMAGEAFEEGTSEYLNAKYQNWTGVDKDAKATVKEIFRSSFIGAMAGGTLTAGSLGIKNASNLQKGTRIVENGNAEAAINTAKHFSKTLNLKAETSGANAERIREQYSELLQQIDKAVDAYEKLPDADKEGTRARLYLGEIQETVAYVEMAAKSSEASIAYKLVLESKPEEAERYAKVVSTVTGKTVTADDIRNNTPMFGKLGAMDMLGAIKYAGEVATDAENSMIENERLNELKNQAIEEANVGTDIEGAASQTVDEVQTATPSQKSTLFAQKPNLNAQVNYSVNPNTSVNTAETAQISTEAQEVSENANEQATTAETQNSGTEKVSIESKKDYDEWFAKNKVEKIRNSKHSSDKLVSAMLDNGIKPSQIFNYDAKSGSSTYNSKLGSIVLDMASNTEGKRAVSTDALAKSIKHNKKAINQLKVSDYDNRSQALLRLEAKILGNAIEIDGKPLPKWFLSLYGTNYGVSDRYADTGIEGAETSNEGNVNRAISLEEAEEQRKSSMDALLAEENDKAKKQAEAKKAKAEADAKAKAKAEAEAKEAEKAAHWDAYTKARDEATLAFGVDRFALMSAEARNRVTRMYMELSGVKEVTKETKKALASILAVRPGLYVFTTDKLADNGAWWYNKATGGRAIVINKNSGAITNTLLHEITHDLAKENSKHYENLSKAVLANTSKEDQQKVYDAYLMRHLRDYNQIDESATLEEAKAVFKTFSEENQKHFDDMVKEEITTRAVAEKLGQKNFLHEHGKEHRFAIMKAIAHLRKLGSSLVHRSTADKYVREIEKNFKAAVFKDNAQAERFMKRLGEWEKEEREESLRRDIANYTEKQYNDFGWAKEAGAISENELRDFESKIMAKGSLAKFKKSANGEAIVEVNDKYNTTLAPNNVFVFATGRKDNYHITRVVRLNLYDEDSIDIIKEDIYAHSNDRALQTYALRIGDELIQYYVRENHADYRKYKNEQRSRSIGGQSQGDSGTSGIGNLGEGSSQKTQSNVKRSIDLDSPVAKLDRAYLEAVERGDMEAVQEMVDKAAKAKGYAIKAYHGTNAEFNTFDKERVGKGNDQYGAGFYFATEKEAASYYGRRVINAFLSIKKPIKIASENLINANFELTEKQAYKVLQRLPNIYDAEESPLGDYYDSYWEEGPQEWMIEDLANQYRNVGLLDSDLFRNYPNELHEALRDIAGYDGVEVSFKGKEGKFFVAWFDNQMKSAEPITYDDNGNVIPLSQRFDSKETDIRRSINISDRIITTHDERTKVQKAKDFAKEVKSRGVKGNAQVAKSKGEDAFVKAQIQLTNAQAGIEYFLKQEGMSQLEVEASVNMVRMSARKGTAAITAKQTDINGNIIGEGFNEIMRPINKSNREDFKSYWVHKLNTYRAPRGKAVFNDVTAEESASEVERLEKIHPEFKDVIEKLNEFDKNALQLAVDARLISQEQADAYHQLNPYYFPVVRFKDADPKKFKSGAFRFKNLNKQAKGGEADIVDPIEAYMDHIVTLERSAYINILANAIYDHEDGINVVSARERIPNFDKKLKDEGREGLIGMNYRDGIEPKSNTVVFFRDGEALAIDVSTEIMDGFRALQGDHNSYFDSAIGKANTAAIRLFSKLVTTYNPFFIIRNMWRDFQDAGIYSQFGLRKFAKAYATTSLRQIMTNGNYWQEYIANGCFDTSMFDYSLGTEANRIGLKKAQGNPLSQAATLFENTQIFVEQLPRFTEYMLSRQAGNDIKTSLYLAADVTVNFGRSGKLTKTLGKTLIPFLNPSVQGFSKNVRHFKDATNFKDYERWKKSAKSFLISAVALGIAPILLSNLMYEDDEEYQDLNDNIKTNYYLIRYGEGKYIRVPRGRLSSAFASVTNTTQSQVKSKKVDARQWMDTFENVMSNTTPFETATRTIFSPITDAKTNTTWYGGEIESQAYDHVAPAQRYDEYTSGIAKWLGKTFNDSPKKIDYVLDQYSGVIGDILLPLTADKRKSDNVVETLFSSMVTDATYSNKLSKEFYEIYDEVDFAEETMDNVLVKKHLEKVKTAVRDLNKDIDNINADSSLSDEEKVKRAKEIRVLINRTYKTAIEDYELVKQKAQTVQSAYENVFTTAEVTKTNYKAFGLDKDDIGTYAIVYSVGDESYAAQTRDTIDEAQEYLESALESAAFADMYLDAYGAEAAMKAYSSSFYEKATVANALGADYENMYRLLLETRYMPNAEKKKRVNEYLRSMPYPTNVKYLIKYIFGDTTKKTKQRAALALKRSDVDDEIKKEWLKKLK